MGIVVHKIRVKKVKKTAGGEVSTLRVLNDDSSEYLRELTYRVLFGEDTIGKQDVLPPLTMSNELDVKLYALFALLLKNFVFGWYSESLQLGGRAEFTKELVYLFAHVCRALQERAIVAQDELVAVLIVDLPILVKKHLMRISEVLSDPGVEEDEVEKVWLERYGNGLGDEETLGKYRRVIVHGIVRELFPQEVLNSRVSREFVVSLIDGVALRSVTESVCDNFTLWGIIGKLAEKLTKEDEVKENDTFLSKLHRILEFFVVDSQYDVQAKNELLTFDHLIPLIEFVDYLTNCMKRFPLSMAFLHILGFALMSFQIIKRFVNACLKRSVYENILTVGNIGYSIDTLRHILFPLDDKFAPEPRYVPSTMDEIEIIRIRNEEKIRFFLQNSKLRKIFVDSNEGIEDIERKITTVIDAVKYRRINTIFIQEMIDLILCRLFPELKGIKLYK